MLIRKITHYQFPDLTLEPLQDGLLTERGFYISFPVPTEFPDDCRDTVLLHIPGSLTLRLICRSYTPGPPYSCTYDREGCFYYRETDEWILEAECRMITADSSYSDTYFLRLPLSAPFAREGKLGFWFDGTWLRFMKDGYVLNENSGLDRFAVPAGMPEFAPGWEKVFVGGPCCETKVTYTEQPEEGNADFYSPLPWNAFAGDVMNFYHDGLYHLIYLRDRRHHGSRNGEGSHDIYQLTSRDLMHWQEQEPVAAIDAPWKTYGTGTMLFHKGRYYMVYGYHTERYHGANEQVECSFDEKNQTFPFIDGETLLGQGKLPAGASWSVSDDGIHFTPSYILFHPGRNPSTYVTPEGKLRLYAGYMGTGIWESEGFDQPFRQTGEDFSFVERSVMKNSTECPCAFTWNGYKYLIIGFTGYYRSLTQGGDYADMAGREEIYDGLGVPMVSTFGENRRIMAGWLNGIGWGSVIVHRELLQEENGRLGMRWVPEMIPETEGENLLPNSGTCNTALDPDASYLLELKIDPKTASHMGIQLSNGDQTVEFQLDFLQKRMQISETSPGILADPLPTACEAIVGAGESVNWKSLKIAYNTKDFCIGDIPGLNEPFSLRLIIRSSHKMRSTVIDTEVAARRTLISVRKDFFPEALSVVSDGTVSIDSFSLKKLKYTVM